MAYDRADWHYGGDYPKDLPPENGGTHIGMFLAWIITRNLESALLREVSPIALDAVRKREITGRDYLFDQCDEKFIDQDVSDEGNAFTQAYYEANTYLEDYERVLGQGLASLYEVPDTWANFDVIAPVIDDRFRRWKDRERSKTI